MKTTVHLEGILELVLERAVELGLARSKTDALRLGVMELNREYGLVNARESNLVIEKMQKMEAENRRNGLKVLSEENVLDAYPHLKTA